MTENVRALRSLTLQILALRSQTLRSLALWSLALRSLALWSLALQSFALQSLALRSPALQSLALWSLALQSLPLQILVLRSLALRSLALRSLFEHLRSKNPQRFRTRSNYLFYLACQDGLDIYGFSQYILSESMNILAVLALKPNIQAFRTSFDIDFAKQDSAKKDSGFLNII